MLLARGVSRNGNRILALLRGALQIFSIISRNEKRTCELRGINTPFFGRWSAYSINGCGWGKSAIMVLLYKNVDMRGIWSRLAATKTDSGCDISL